MIKQSLRGAAIVLVLFATHFLAQAAWAQACSTAADCQVFPQYEVACVDSECSYTCGTGTGEGCGPDWTEFVTSFQRNVIALDEPINWYPRIGGHNATSSIAYGQTQEFGDPNQTLDVTGQLNAGARILAIDLHVLDGDLYLCHNDLCLINKELFADIMAEIGTWLNNNPGEFIYIDMEYLPYGSCELLAEGECQDASLTFEQILMALEDGVRNGLGADRVYRPTDVFPTSQDGSGNDRYVHPETSPYYCSTSGNYCANDDTLCPVGETCELAYPSSAGEQKAWRWPTLRELRAQGKQVFLSIGGTGGCCGFDCGEYTVGDEDDGDPQVCSSHSTAATSGQACTDDNDCIGLANTMSWLWRDVAPSGSSEVTKDFDYATCGGGLYFDPDGSDPVEFSRVAEARTLLDTAADTSGIIEEGDVAALMECNVSRIDLDFVDAAEDTPPNTCAMYIGCERELFGLNDVIPGGFGCLVATCPADDTRILRTAWSWKWGRTPSESPRDTRIFMNGVDGRWNPTAVENQPLFRCACGNFRVGEPDDWPDKHGDVWEVTSQGAAFNQTPESDPRDAGQLCQLACQAEHNLDFALPTTAYQNRNLYDTLIAASAADGTSLTQENVWVRLSRNAGGGPWSSSIRPWITSLAQHVSTADPDRRDFTAVVENPDGYQTKVIFVGDDGVSSDFLDPSPTSGTTETFEWTKPFGSEGEFSIEAQLWGHPDPNSDSVFHIADDTVTFDFEFANVPPTIMAFTEANRSGLTEICADTCIGHLLQVPGTFNDPDVGDPFQVRVLYGDADDPVCDVTAGVCTGASGGTRACTANTDCGLIVPFQMTSPQTYTFEMTNLYAQSGVYNGTIVVDDGTDEAIHNFTVNNVDPPVAPQIGGGCASTMLILGDPFTCSPAFTDFNAEDTHTVQVDWGDGSDPEDLSVSDLSAFGHFVILNHTFQAAGTYPVVLTITDSGNLMASKTYRVTVEETVPIEPPTIVMVNADGSTTAGPVFPNLSGTDGQPVSRTFRIIDNNQSHTQWSMIIGWGDFFSEGSVVTNDTFSNLMRNGDGNVEVTASHTYPCSFESCSDNSTGTFGVWVFARAVLGATDFGPFSVAHTFTADITSDNEAPDLDGLNTEDAEIDEGGLFSRAGQSFSDADENDPWVVYVDYGDGVIEQPTLTDKSFGLSHVYADNGTYPVEVIVTDGVDNDTESFEVVVNNVAPTAAVGPDQQVTVGEMVEASGTWTDPAASFDEPYDWSWSVDGVEQTSGTATYGANVPYSTQFATPGARTLTFEVTDKDGADDSASLTVDVGGDPPVANAGPDLSLECAAPAGTMATLDGSGSFDPDNGSLDYLWTSSAFPDAASVTVTASFPLGSTAASLQVTDEEMKSASDELLVVVTDTLAPGITAPADITLECAATGGTTADIGQPVVADSCDANPAVENDAPAVFPLGITTVEWTATDAEGNTATASQQVEVVDDTPPVVTASAGPSYLWPPNHRMIDVNIRASGADACDAAAICRIVGVSSNETANGRGDGNTDPDWIIHHDDLSVKLRAERAGGGDGREYYIEVACEDASGRVGYDTVTVGVGRNR